MIGRTYTGSSERAKSRELWPTRSSFFLSERLVPPLTSLSRPHRVQLMSLMWWMRPGLPCFFFLRSSASVYYTERKPKNENGGGLGTRLGFCFVSCYCIVVDNVNKQIGFHGNAQPSCKQHQLIKAALKLFQPTRCWIFLITRQSWYCLNALHTQNSELEIGYGKFMSRVNRQKCLEIRQNSS